MDVEPRVSLSLSLSPAGVDVFVLLKRESESPESYLDGRGDGVFLSLMQDDLTTVGDFN